MKTVYLLSLILVVAGCSHDEPVDDFDQFDDYARFSLNGKKIVLVKASSNGGRGVVSIDDDAGKIDSVKIVVKSCDVSDGTGVLNFYIIRTFLAEYLGVNPDDHITTDFEITQDHLHTIFSEPGSVIKGVPPIFTKSKDGAYMLFVLEGEYYTALPKIEIDNKEKQSVFQFKRSQSSAANHIKAEYRFDMYMKGQSSGNIIHLEDGKFITSYRWGEL